MEKIITVRIDDGGENTIGTIRDSKSIKLGDIIIVRLHDENGKAIYRNGTVKEIF
jgi:hypothetical protein